MEGRREMKGEDDIQPATEMEEKRRTWGRNQGINELFDV